MTAFSFIIINFFIQVYSIICLVIRPKRVPKIASDNLFAMSRLKRDKIANQQKRNAPGWVRSNRQILFEEIFQTFAAAGMAQFAKCFGFDLTNPFPGDAKDFPHFFQSAGASIIQSKT